MIRSLKIRSKAIAAIRARFQQDGLHEVATPAFVASGAIEPYLEPFQVKNTPYILPTSPEFSLKKSFGAFADEPGIYEIAHAFRNEPLSGSHLHEFLMVEWYRNRCRYTDLEKDIAHIAADVARCFQAKPPEFERASIAQLFHEIFGAAPSPQWKYADYYRLANQFGLTGTAENTSPVSQEKSELLLIEYFSVLFDYAIRKKQEGQNRILIVIDFPAEVRGMAALNMAGWAERIEAFLGEFEIASGYQEMYEPDELHDLWTHNNALRKAMNAPEHPVDRGVIESAPQMKGVAGIALGFERLLSGLATEAQIRHYSLGWFY